MIQFYGGEIMIVPEAAAHPLLRRVAESLRSQVLARAQLLEVSRGAIQPQEVEKRIQSRDREQAGTTAPPWGLYLNRVFYPWDKPW